MMRIRVPAIAAIVAAITGLVAWMVLGGPGDVPVGRGPVSIPPPTSTSLNPPDDVGNRPRSDPVQPSAIPIAVPRGEAEREVGSPTGGARTLEISGRIIEGKGVPVAGADVSIDVRRVDRPASLPGRERLAVLSRSRSGDDGRFRLHPDEDALQAEVSGPALGPWLVVRREGFGVRLVSFTTGGRPTTDLGDIVLEPGAVLSGRVVDQAGAPVADAGVTADPVAPLSATEFLVIAEAASVVTTPDGRFMITGLGAGRWVLSVRAPGRMLMQVPPTTVGPGEETDLGDIPLPRRPVVSGRVLDVDGRPIREAMVNLAGSASVPEPARGGEIRPAEAREVQLASARTGPDGAFRLEVPRAEPMPVIVRAPGFREQGPTLPVDQRNDVVLERLPQLVVQVVDEANRHVAGALVTEADVCPATSWTTDESGRARIVTDAAAIRVAAGGRADLLQVLEPRDLDRGFLEVVLQPAARVVGRLTDSRARPVAGLVLHLSRVRFRPRADPDAREVVTDSSGRFAFEGLSAEQWMLSAWRRPDAELTQVLDLTPGETRSLELAFDAGAGLQGDVTRGDLPAGPGTRIEVRAVGRETVVMLTDSHGRFEATGLAPGRVELAVDGEPRSEPVELVAGEVAEVHLATRVGARISGQVTAGGTPLARARVSLSGPERVLATSTDEDGRYHFENLAPGLHALTVRSRNHLPVTRPPLMLGPGDSAVLDVALGGRLLRVSVVAEETGLPIGGVSIGVGPMSGPPLGTWETDARGELAVDDVEPGSYRVTVSCAGRVTESRELRVAAEDGSCDAVFRLRQGVEVRWQVVTDEDASDVAIELGVAHDGSERVEWRWAFDAPSLQVFCDPGAARLLVNGMQPESGDADPVLLASASAQLVVGQALPVTVRVHRLGDGQAGAEIEVGTAVPTSW